MKKDHTKSSRKKTMEREKKERIQEFNKLYPKKKPYPTATISEIRKNAKVVGDIIREGDVLKKYKKGNFMYSIDGSGDILAVYLPSQKKRLKIMFEWKHKKKKWDLLTYRKGDW